MKKIEIDFEKLRAGEEVKCPKCKNGVFRTEYDSKYHITLNAINVE